LLQGVQQLAGTPVVDAVVGQGGEDFGESDLHVEEGPGKWCAGPKGIVEAAEPFEVLPTLVIALVVEAEFHAAEGGGATEDAIVLAMGTGGIGHGRLQNLGESLFAVRCWLFAKGEESVVTGCPRWAAKSCMWVTNTHVTRLAKGGEGCQDFSREI
jgi:hypothetical protein